VPIHDLRELADHGEVLELMGVSCDERIVIDNGRLDEGIRHLE
jgi:hypothetical protein